MCEVAMELLIHCEHILLNDDKGPFDRSKDTAEPNHQKAVSDKPMHASRSADEASTSSKSAGLQQRRPRLVRPLAEQRSNKARLLHYYPNTGGASTTRDAWCGWHFDHGTLTGLTAAMFLPSDAPGASLSAAREVASPDRQAGLHIRTAMGEIVRVSPQRDQLLFQAGQCLEILSGGRFRATQHCVYGPLKQLPVSRNTFAVFCQPKCALLSFGCKHLH